MGKDKNTAVHVPVRFITLRTVCKYFNILKCFLPYVFIFPHSEESVTLNSYCSTKNSNLQGKVCFRDMGDNISLRNNDSEL